MNARLISLSLLAMVLLSAIISCSYVDEQPALAPTHDSESEEWTVLFYGAGSTSADVTDDGHSSVLTTLESMQSVYAVSAANVVACINSSYTGGEARIYAFPSASETRTMPPAADYLNWGNRDMSSTQTLADFVAYGTAEYPADKYALVIMGQGYGWQGIVRDDMNGGGQSMSLSGFRQAITSSINHLDLIAWLVPGMSSVEVAYECHAFADYMVGCAWPLAHDVSRSPRVWLMDLMQNPGMNAERLGMMMVDGLYESAREENDSAHYALLQLQNLSSLVPEIDSLATALAPYTEDETLELPALWTAVWVAQTDDSQSVDVGRLSEQVLAEPALAEDPSVLQAAQHVIESLYDLVVYHRTTVGGESRQGVSIFLPFHPDTILIAEYAELSLSVDHPGWASLLRATAESAPALTTLSGNARWAGHVIESIYSFLNTNQFGSPVVSLTQAANIVEVISQDNVLYAASIVLPADSVPCYIGLFEDLDHSATLTAGDRYGYYGVSPQPRTWMTLHPGDHLENVNIQLNLTF